MMSFPRICSFFFATTTLVLFSCGGATSDSTSSSDAKAGNSKSTTSSVGGDPARSAVYQKGLSLVANSDCLTCHKIDEKQTGPSYRDIAKKYAGAPNDVITALAGTIINGGSGNWGNVPMTPHPSLSQDDAETMVRYILELNNN